MNWRRRCDWEHDSDSEILPMFLQVSGTLLYGRILPNKRWIVARLFLAILTTVACCNSLMFSIRQEQISTSWYFIYYTHWILWLILFYFWTSFICTWVIYQSNVAAFTPYWISLRELHITPLVAVNRISLYVALSNSWVAILAYWILIFRADNLTESSWSVLTQVVDNGVIYFLFWLDYLCSLHDIPSRSVLYALGCAGIYLFVTIMFEHVFSMHAHHSTVYIYEFLQWSVKNDNYGMAILISLVMFIVIVLFQIMWIFTKQVQLQNGLPLEIIKDLDSKSFRELKQTGKCPKMMRMKVPTRDSDENISVVNKIKNFVRSDAQTKKNNNKKCKNKKNSHRHLKIKQETDVEMVNGGEIGVVIQNNEVRVTHDIIEDEDSSVHSE